MVSMQNRTFRAHDQRFVLMVRRGAHGVAVRGAGDAAMVAVSVAASLWAGECTRWFGKHEHEHAGLTPL